MSTTAPMFLELDQEERERELEVSDQQQHVGSDNHGHHLKGKRVLLAAEKGDLLNLVIFLSKDPKLISYVDADGYTPLHRASYGGHIDCAKYLVRHGANLEATTSDGWTPLHCAVRWNNIVVADYLVNQGANVNARSIGNNTPLHIVASNGRYSITCDIIQLLLFHPDCDFTIRNSSGDTAFDIARRTGPFYKFWNGVMTIHLDDMKCDEALDDINQ